MNLSRSKRRVTRKEKNRSEGAALLNSRARKITRRFSKSSHSRKIVICTHSLARKSRSNSNSSERGNIRHAALEERAECGSFSLACWALCSLANAEESQCQDSHRLFRVYPHTHVYERPFPKIVPSIHSDNLFDIS